MDLTPYKEQYAVMNGPGDGRPTALQIIKDNDLFGKLSGIVALITGGTAGLGVETVRALHETGADVYFTARSADKGEATLENIRSKSSGTGKLEYIIMELDSLESVTKGSLEFFRRSKTLNILVGNAGIMSCPEGTTKDGFETQFGTNHLGHFALFHLLKETMLASSTPEFNSRYVSVSSAGHRLSTIHFDDYNLKKQGYDPRVSYGQSKTANIYMANEIERRYSSQGLHAWSLHPGAIQTNLGRFLDKSLLDRMRADADFSKLLMSPEQGAATQVWAAVAKDLEGKGGRYLCDCGVAGPMAPNAPIGASGYVPHAYDEAAAQRLWVESLEMVGVSDDDEIDKLMEPPTADRS